MKRRALTFLALIVLGLIEIGAFLTATSFIQLGIAAVFYPVLAFVILKLTPGKTKKALPIEASDTITSINTPSNKDEEITDTNKRAFLNVIFTTGIAFFIYSIINKKAELSFFGKATGSGVTALQVQDISGNKINPAKDQPTDGYQLSDIDDLGIDYIYYGYTRTDGYWYIAKHDVASGAFRYVKGQSNFPSSWSNRSHLKYDYFYIVFS